MNSHVTQFYQESKEEQKTPFFQVILVGDSKIDWEEIVEMVPTIPRGWYELSFLDVSDRIEFTRDFWQKTLPYHPKMHDFLFQFFSKLDDVGVFLTKETKTSPFVVEAIYSLEDDTCFFRGNPACSEDMIEKVKLEFENQLPGDFLSFMRIHDGFSKHTDTGIIRAENIKVYTERLHSSILDQGKNMKCHGKTIDPTALIPFYECFGLHSYQCFFADWYPGNEMGNVCYSSIDSTISDYTVRSAWEENLVFPTFLDWLIFYLEQVE